MQLPLSLIYSTLLASREPSLNRDFTHTHTHTQIHTQTHTFTHTHTLTQTYINFKGLNNAIKIGKFIS
jgi:hypothetical protein